MKNKKIIGTMMCAVVLANVSLATLATNPNMTVSAVAEAKPVKAPAGMREFVIGTLDNPVRYTAGEEIYWEGKVYKVIQSHLNHGDLWYPDVPALFEYVRTVSPDEFKQEISLGGQGVGSDDAHKSGFARVRLDMLDGKLSLIKNSDYQYHWYFNNEKYASLKISDEKGKVLYNKSWNGNDKITDLAKGKFGEFASYKLADGSTVEIYHAEGKNHRFHTNNDTELKAKKVGTAYKYTVKDGQLKLVTEVTPVTPPMVDPVVPEVVEPVTPPVVDPVVPEVTEPIAPSAPKEINFDGKVVKIASKAMANSGLEFIWKDDNYGSNTTYRVNNIVSRAATTNTNQQWKLVKVNHPDADENTYMLANESITNSKKFFGNAGLDDWTYSLVTSSAVGKSGWFQIEKTNVEGEYKITNSKDGIFDLKYVYGVTYAGFVKTDTNSTSQRWFINEVEKETANSVVLYGATKNVKPRVTHNEYPISVPKMQQFNDDIGAVKLPAGTSITLWANNSYSGNSVTFKNDTDKTQSYDLDVAGGMNNKTSSYKIYDNRVKLYNDYNGGGKETVHTEEALSVKSMSADNDKLSSVRLPAHTSITLYSDANFKGQKLIVRNTSDTSNVYNVTKEMNDKTSSYEFSKDK